MTRIDRARRMVSECLEKGIVSTEGLIGDIRSYINDSANCYAESYDDYLYIWNILEEEFIRENVQ